MNVRKTPIYAFDTNIVIYDALKGTVEKDHPLRSYIDYFLNRLGGQSFILIPQPVIDETLRVIDEIYEFLINTLRDLLKCLDEIIKRRYGLRSDPYIVVEKFFNEKHQALQTSNSYSGEPERYRRLLRYLELEIIRIFDEENVDNANKAYENVSKLVNSLMNDHVAITQHIINIEQTNQQYKKGVLPKDVEKAYLDSYERCRPGDLSIHDSDWKILFWLFTYQWSNNEYVIFVTVDFRLLSHKDKLMNSYMIYVTSPLYATKLREQIEKSMKAPKEEIHKYASEGWAKAIELALTDKGVI